MVEKSYNSLFIFLWRSIRAIPVYGKIIVQDSATRGTTVKAKGGN